MKRKNLLKPCVFKPRVLKPCVFKHTAAVVAIAGFAFLALGSAATTSGPVMVKAYEMQIMPAKDTLHGKRAVVFDLVMADKVLPTKAVGTSGGGGLVGAALSLAGNAADLASFNNSAGSEGWIAQEHEALLKKQPVLFGAFSERYTQLNDAEAVRASFNFGNAKLTTNYFVNADADVKQRIAQICAQRNADFAVAIVGQMRHADTMNAAPITVPTTITAEVCLFDKTGVLVSHGKTETIQYTFRPNAAINAYNLLLEDAIENIVLMIPALGGNGQKTGSKAFVQPVLAVDTGDTREARQGETVLVVKRIDTFAGWPTELVLNKGTVNERNIPLASRGEVRVVIPNGETVMAAEVVPTGTKERNDPVTFIASGEPVTYTLSVKGTIGQGNLKANERFTWIKQ